MKLKFITIIALFLFVYNAFGQLEKGGWMIDGGANFNLHGTNELLNDGSVLAGFSLGLGNMITDRVMIGSGLSVSSGNFVSFIGSIEPFQVQIYNYRVSPFVRYYLNSPQKFRPFGYLENNLRMQVFEQKEGIEETELANSTSFKSYLGIGFDYFLHPNVALEAQLGYKVIDSKGSTYFNNGLWDDLGFTIGIQTFLNQKRSDEFDLMNAYLKRGNFVTSSYGYFSADFEKKNTALIINPKLSYFISDRVSIGGELNLNYRSSEYSKSTGISWGANGEVYIPIGERLFLTPKARIGAGVALSKFKGFNFTNNRGGTIVLLQTDTLVIGGIPIIDTTQIITSIEEIEIKSTHFGLTGNFALELNYFSKKNYLFFGGLRNQWQFDFDEQGDLTSHSGFLAAYTGLEYFFTENLSIRSSLSFNVYDIARLGEEIFLFSNGSKHLGLNFSFSYFIPGKTKE